MLNAIFNEFFGLFGFKLIKTTRYNPIKKIKRRIDSKKQTQDFIGSIKNAPLNPEYHFNFAIQALKNEQLFLSYAELKTACFLGLKAERATPYFKQLENSITNIEEIDHNQFFRYSTLANAISSKRQGSKLSILDVGGGHGQLAYFIQEDDYSLVEPDINGLSGICLPFPDRSFDYVVSCHVLEHIPPHDRKTFLDQLLVKSKHGIILLNPFQIENSHIEERLKLVLDITKAKWAQEHLNCTLPTIEFIETYAKERKLNIKIEANGTMTTTLALVFLEYFALKAGDTENWKKINRLFNEKFGHALNCNDYPTGYLIYLDKVKSTPG